MCKGSQLTLKQRNILETLLNEGHKLCDITSILDRYPRVIRYEIMTHRALFIRKNQRNNAAFSISVSKKDYAIIVIRAYANIVFMSIVILSVLIFINLLSVNQFFVFLVFVMGVPLLKTVLYQSTIIKLMSLNPSI